MEKISQTPQVAASYDKNVIPNQPQVKPAAQKEDSFELTSGKKPVLIAGAVGAIGSGFGINPIAKYIANKKIDKGIDTFLNLISKDITVEDLKLMANDGVISKFFEEETLIKSGLSEEVAKKTSDDFKKLLENPTEIEEFVKNTNKGKNRSILGSMLANMDEEVLKKLGISNEIISEINEKHLKGIESGVEGRRIWQESDYTPEYREALKKAEDEIYELIPKNSDAIKAHFKEVLNPTKESLIEQFVKVSGKYKAIAAVVGGLSLAGLVAMIKPSDKKEA